MKKIITILLILLIIPLVYANNETGVSQGKELCNYIFAKTNIDIGTAVPNTLPYRNERFNIFTNEGEVVGHLIFEKGLVNSYNCELTEEPTYNVNVQSKQTIDDILEAESRIKMLNKKLNNKEIKVDGVNFGKDIKGFFTKIGLNIASVFM